LKNNTTTNIKKQSPKKNCEHLYLNLSILLGIIVNVNFFCIHILYTNLIKIGSILFILSKNYINYLSKFYLLNFL